MRTHRTIRTKSGTQKIDHPVAYAYGTPTQTVSLPIIIDDRALANRLETNFSALWGAVITKERQYTPFYIRRNGKARLIHKPKPSLHYIQHMLLEKIFNYVPMQKHVVAYVLGRNSVYGAAQHVGKEVVLSLDIAGFFHAVKRAQIRKSLCAYYPRPVAHLIAELVTCENFVPQGASTSGAVANLVAQDTFDKDILEQLPEWTYTRYSDDLTFSCVNRVSETELLSAIERVVSILEQHGFALNRDKTRWAYAPQKQIVLGLQVNTRVCLASERYRKIRGKMRVCARDGLEAEARRLEITPEELYSYLRGIMSYVHSVDVPRWEKLVPLFEKIPEVCREGTNGDGTD